MDAHAGRSSWRGKRWANAVGVLAASLAVAIGIATETGAQLATSPTASAGPTATVSGVADPNSASTYLSRIGPAYDSMESAVQNVVTAVNNQDWDGSKSACQGLDDAAARIHATLPAPDSRVTHKIRATVDNINSAADACMAFGPNTTQADFDKFVSDINDARAHFKSAQQILASAH